MTRLARSRLIIDSHRLQSMSFFDDFQHFIVLFSFK